MKKTRGKKKKINHPKKEHNFFIFKNKVAPLVLALVVLALAILLPFFTTGNAVNSSVTGHAALDNPVSFSGGWWDAINNWINLGNTWREVIVFIIVLLIIFAILMDGLLMSSLFSGWVCFIIALGFSIIGALTNIIRELSVWIITISAGLGIAAGFIEIIVSLFILVGLTFASSKIAIFAAKRRAQREEIRAIKGAGQAGGAITALKMIQKKFKHRP